MVHAVDSPREDDVVRDESRYRFQHANGATCGPESVPRHRQNTLGNRGDAKFTATFFPCLHEIKRVCEPISQVIAIRHRESTNIMEPGDDRLIILCWRRADENPYEIAT